MESLSICGPLPVAQNFRQRLIADLEESLSLVARLAAAEPSSLNNPIIIVNTVKYSRGYTLLAEASPPAPPQLRRPELAVSLLLRLCAGPYCPAGLVALIGRL